MSQHFETMVEIVYIWMGVTVVHVYGISSGGQTQPDFADSVYKGIIQTAAELAVDLVSVVIITSLQRYPLLEMAELRFRYWSAVTSIFMFQTSAFTCANVLPHVLCHEPSGHSTEFVFCN